MPNMTPVPDDHPLQIAWKAYRETEDFDNAEKWAASPEHLIGSLWAMFAAGFNAGADCSPKTTGDVTK